MKTLNRTLVVAVLLASMAGFQSTASSAPTASVSPPVRNVTGCCMIFYNNRWMCVPC